MCGVVGIYGNGCDRSLPMIIYIKIVNIRTEEFMMNKIASFTVNHIDLLTGIYVSRKDYLDQVTLTTFDLRFTRPNLETVMGTAGIHTLEHLGATFLRNHDTWKDSVIYFGPMGCRTGFYLILAKDLESKDIVDLMKEMADYVLAFEGEIPGYSARDCGNYLDNDLEAAKEYMMKYRIEVLDSPTEDRLVYPE